jgi:hypothetical protein
MFWLPIYDLQWEIMNVYTVHEIFFEKPTDNSIKLTEF